MNILLGRRVLEIQHVGSTAIRGVPAKPIIDMLAAVQEYKTGFDCVEILEQFGYAYHGENHVAMQYFFTKGNPPKYHLYLVEMGNEMWVTRRAFRDHLRQNPDLKERYTELKMHLVAQFPRDLEAYQKGKGDFVLSVLEEIGVPEKFRQRVYR